MRTIVAKAVKNLLIASHHSKLLACDALLRGAVALNELEKTRQGIDLPLQRVHLSCQHTSATIQHEEVTRAVLAALHREKDRETDQSPPNNSFHQGYRLPQRPRCNRTRLQTVNGTARIFGN